MPQKTNHRMKRASIIICLVPVWHFVNIAVERYMQRFDQLTEVPEGEQPVKSDKIAAIQQTVKRLKWQQKNVLNFYFN